MMKPYKGVAAIGLARRPETYVGRQNTQVSSRNKKM